MNYPEIRIKDGWLLRQEVSKPLHKLWAKKDQKLADDKWMEWKVGEYNKAWKPYEHKVIHGMSDITGLEFRQNIIDVYIASWFRAFSDPMVIGVIFEPDLFVDILTHELIHRLLTDNTAVAHDAMLFEEWKKLFGKHTFGTTVHIPVHAIHKAVFIDVMKAPQRLEREKEKCEEHKAKDYIMSWEYVEKHGYKEIIEKLKKSYNELKTGE